MSGLVRGVEAVTFDFFNTLVFHREGHGRGRAVMAYLGRQGFECAPWRHEILYEIFDGYERVGSPSAPPEERHRRRRELAERLFQRLEVPASDEVLERHTEALWTLLGPGGFDVFPEVPATLSALRSAGYKLAIISNWPCGLAHFCTELGLVEHFDAIFCSAEVGAAKPEGRIFAVARARLGVAAERILHVGDSSVEDYAGAAAAGFRSVLIDRERARHEGIERVIHGLDELGPGR
jgi:HAD superfamily hydrolase (TIGR01549 family)